jgi:hypothetical protein
VGHDAKPVPGCTLRSLSEALQFHSRKGKWLDNRRCTSGRWMEKLGTSSVSLWTEEEKTRIKRWWGEQRVGLRDVFRGCSTGSIAASTWAANMAHICPAQCPTTEHGNGSTIHAETWQFEERCFVLCNRCYFSPTVGICHMYC